MKQLYIIIVLILYTVILTAKNNKAQYFFVLHEKQTFTLSLYSNGFYEFATSITISNDQIEEIIISDGTYTVKGDILELIDNDFKFKLLFHYKGRKYIRGFKCFNFLNGVQMNYVGHVKSDNLPSITAKKPIKQKINISKKLQAKIGSYKLSNTYLWICLNLKKDSFEYSIHSTPILKGDCKTKGNHLYLHDKFLNYTFVFPILKNNIVADNFLFIGELFMRLE
jgi:hypothetical protein